jgi:negative regulator of flagellin synthesis FlgM
MEVAWTNNKSGGDEMMRIDGHQPVQRKYEVNKMYQPEVKRTEQAKDDISISNEARLLNETSQLSIREKKLLDIKQRIESGQYQIDAHEIAKKVSQFYAI